MVHSRLSCPSEPSFPSLPLSGEPFNELLGALYPERDREDIAWSHPLHPWLIERPHERKWVRCRLWHPLPLKEPVLAQVDGSFLLSVHMRFYHMSAFLRRNPFPRKEVAFAILHALAQRLPHSSSPIGRSCLGKSRASLMPREVAAVTRSFRVVSRLRQSRATRNERYASC